MLSDALRAELIAVAHALADAARQETLQHFRSHDLATESKAEAFDPVTVADRNAEEAMRRILAERRPADGIVGEEFDDIPGTSGLTWVIDPIDGTRAYISGAPTWGVLIAVGDGTGPLFGIVDQPFIGERFAGGFGIAEASGPQGHRRLRARGPRPLAEATLMTTFPEVGSEEEGRAFRRVASEVRLVRYGLDCYAYALVAAGQIDLVIEAGLKAFDIQGPMAVIEAAGGVVTNWSGGPAKDGGRILAAANAEVHAAALNLLQAKA